MAFWRHIVQQIFCGAIFLTTCPLRMSAYCWRSRPGNTFDARPSSVTWLCVVTFWRKLEAVSDPVRAAWLRQSPWPQQHGLPVRCHGKGEHLVMEMAAVQARLSRADFWPSCWHLNRCRLSRSGGCSQRWTPYSQPCCWSKCRTSLGFINSSPGDYRGNIIFTRVHVNTHDENPYYGLDRWATLASGWTFWL